MGGIRWAPGRLLLYFASLDVIRLWNSDLVHAKIYARLRVTVHWCSLSVIACRVHQYSAKKAKFRDVTNVLQETFQVRAYPDAYRILSTFDDEFEGVPNNQDEVCGWDLHAKDYIVSTEVVGTDTSSNNNEEPTKNNKGLDQPLLACPAFSRKALNGSGLAFPESVKSITLAFKQSYIGMTSVKTQNLGSNSG